MMSNIVFPEYRYVCSVITMPVYNKNIALQELTEGLPKKAERAIRKTGDGTATAKEVALAVLTMQQFAECVDHHNAPSFVKPLRELL